MRAMRSQQRIGAQAAALLLVAGWACAAEAPPRPRLPHVVNEIVRWLPENTETVAAVQSFNVEDLCDWPAAPAGDASTTTRLLLAMLTLQDFSALGPRAEGEVFGATRLLRMLGKNPVALGVYGGRNYELYDKAVWREAAGILIFQRPLNVVSKDFLETLHAAAHGMRVLARREIWCYARDPQGIPRPLKPSEGLFIAVPRPNVLIWSSSEPYLDELLRRMGSAPLGRALPDGLPEWNAVDLAAGAWLVRHIPQRAARPRLTGLSMSCPPGEAAQLELRYLTAGQEPLELRKELLGGQQQLTRDGAALVATVDLRQQTPADAKERCRWLESLLSLNAALPDDPAAPAAQNLGRL